MTSLIPSPTVSLVNGRPSVTSLKIAEHFGKRHDSVLRDIRRVTGDCPDDFSAHNFVAVDYTDEKGETRPAFNVFQDGFVILVMGYTGAKAMKMKLAYIMVFNAMRDELAGKPDDAPALDTSSRLSTRSDPERKELTAAINAWVSCAPIHYAGARSLVNGHFGVKSVDALTVAQAREAIAFVYAKIAEVAQTQKALPEPQKALPPATPPSSQNEWLRAHEDFERAWERVDQSFEAFRNATDKMSRETIENLGSSSVGHQAVWTLGRILSIHSSTRFAIFHAMCTARDAVR